VSEVRGFCRNKEQEDDLKAYGLTGRQIFMEERGAESLDHCLASFRDRGGILVLSHDLRVLGGTKRQVAEIMARLEKLRIKVTDLTHPEDTTIAELVQRANVLIAGARLSGDRPRARKQGRAGGRRKGEVAWNKRDDLAPRWLLDRIVDHRDVPWSVKEQLLSPHFTQATLRRHYGVRATKRS
jgi:hypothetical protein